MKETKDKLPSLITADIEAGLTLAGRLADRLHAQIERASSRIERPGGTNYLLAAPVSKEIVSGILFYAITAANGGWISEQ